MVIALRSCHREKSSTKQSNNNYVQMLDCHDPIQASNLAMTEQRKMVLFFKIEIF